MLLLLLLLLFNPPLDVQLRTTTLKIAGMTRRPAPHFRQSSDAMQQQHCNVVRRWRLVVPHCWKKTVTQTFMTRYCGVRTASTWMKSIKLHRRPITGSARHDTKQQYYDVRGYDNIRRRLHRLQRKLNRNTICNSVGLFPNCLSKTLSSHVSSWVRFKQVAFDVQATTISTYSRLISSHP